MPLTIANITDFVQTMRKCSFCNEDSEWTADFKIVVDAQSDPYTSGIAATICPQCLVRLGHNYDSCDMDEDDCEFCGEPGKLRIIDGAPNNCGVTERVMCDECYAEEMCG